ncbi:MAG: class I SAM-dependent methyltransferase [Draconibacterium sp.]|nr:class I SAM-dependent methyltransferase [Draconibacterium sp.]
MKSIEESVVIAMDGSDKELFPFLPYILQDIWEIGADPEAIIKLIRKYFNNIAELKVLDLGCGKGAVSVKVSHKLGCTCYGIDAIPEFVEFAQQKATEYKVNHLCIFEIGDIREKVKDLSGFDVVILGAIGSVFGDYYSTLSTLAKCINENGIFIIDDAYINDNSDFSHSLMFKKSDILHQIEMAGMQLVENDIMDNEYIKDSDDYIFENIKRRCNELIEQYPHKQHLFLNYISKQEVENDVLENKVIGTTMVIKKIEK